MSKFKVGDVIEHHWDDPRIHYSIIGYDASNEKCYHLRWTNRWGEVQTSWDGLKLGGYKLVTGADTAPQIDWSKPLEHYPSRTPVHFVGQRADGRYVVENAQHTVIYTVNADGTRDGMGGCVYIRNVPPPPVSRTVYLVLNSNGGVNLSNTKAEAEAHAAAFRNVSLVSITEVTVGPAK